MSLAAQARELATSGDLFRMLVGREIRSRYRQTALGIGWVVLQPLVPAVIFAIVFGAFARLPSGGVPYLEFALSGTVIFGLFSNAVVRASNAYLREGALVTKVYFPRALLPLASGFGAIVDFGVGLVLLLVVMLASGHVPPIGFLAVPIIVIGTLALGLSTGLALAALSAHLRDFAIAVPFAMQVALYASPVFYAADIVPAGFRPAYALNPMVGLTEAFRSAVLGSEWATWPDLGIGLAVGFAISVISIGVFLRASRDLSDVI